MKRDEVVDRMVSLVGLAALLFGLLTMVPDPAAAQQDSDADGAGTAGLPVEEPLAPAAGGEDDDKLVSLGQAGLLGRQNRGDDLPTLVLSAGMPLAEGDLTLQSGRYYELVIEADGSQELALEGDGFFRAIWVDEVVIEGIELRPFGISSMEFDEAGEAEISFVAVKPGSYSLGVPGSELQRIAITIE